MNTLENILNNINEKTIDISIFNKYSDFDYKSKELLNIDLEFLTKNIYNISLITPKITRLSQKEFRKELLKKYGKCLISDNTCLDELEACHLVEVKYDGDYKINNGIILEANFHKTFDRNIWCINPYTKMIEVKKGTNSSINQYTNKILDIDDDIMENLIKRYEKFKLVSPE